MKNNLKNKKNNNKISMLDHNNNKNGSTKI